MIEKAVFGTQAGELVVGYGPFTALAQPPEAGPAFYRNTFDLSLAKPWFVPERLETFDGGGEESAVPSLNWEEPDAHEFAQVFDEVTAAIASGALKKSVPVVVATAQGDLPCDALLAKLQNLPPALRPYGWFGEDGGFVGATPEVLFDYFDGRINTMALAGTAARDEGNLFTVDQKEIREHEFVAQTLVDKLEDLGMVRRNEREVLDLGNLLHFQTKIHVELYKHETIETLIERLHPTPALGPLPRSEETLALLQKWRKRLHCPEAFGAPFGFYREGHFEALVAIRMLSWVGDSVSLPSGCGVIAESRLMNEWRELSLKRSVVQQLFFGSR